MEEEEEEKEDKGWETSEGQSFYNRIMEHLGEKFELEKTF